MTSRKSLTFRRSRLSRTGLPALTAMIATALGTAGFAAGNAASPVRITAKWSDVTGVSHATPTLQVVVNPLLRPESPVSRRALAAVRRLGANDVRFVPWLPYPRLAVAELKPPLNGQTSWNFKLIDPMVRAFMRATRGHAVIMNFSTIPQWLFKTPKPVAYPHNPDQVDWGYEQGTHLGKGGLKAVADYYARLVSWYTSGGFRDEAGKWHRSGYHYQFAWWEVLNEVEWEHHMSVQVYTRYYDAITAAIHRVSPKTRFVGMALGEPGKDAAWFKYFLNRKNHAPGTPLNMISYHFYAQPGTAPPASWPGIFFRQAGQFLGTVRMAEKICRKLSPDTKTDVDELGSILPHDTDAHLWRPIPHAYWNLSGAMYAYLYAKLAAIGINVVGESQLIGYPSQFPSVSMVNWHTGVPNARFRVLELLVRNFGPGDKMAATKVRGGEKSAKRTGSAIFAQAFITGNGARKILIVNRADQAIPITLPGAGNAELQWVDQKTGSRPPEKRRLAGNQFVLNGLGVAVVKLIK